jgi:2,4-dienoyl-CoA reductase-like NADH-dependent reductase (Old Yellow Enzyme family)
MLFEPLQISGIQLKNRIVISPMCQYSSVDGFANDWHLVHLGCRAVGGAALVIQEATAVTPDGRISPDDMGLWKDEQTVQLKKITQFIKKNGAVPGIQLAHAGRKASTSCPWKGGRFLKEYEGGWIPLSPSGIPFRETDGKPKTLTQDDLLQLREDFKSAARRALEAGYEVLEIHAAHGYLLHSFLSPLSNLRKDIYGGSFDNRIRLLEEVASDVRNIWPEHLPLFVRISATDYVEGGWNLNESVNLAVRLKGLGIDVIDVSSGGIIPNVKIQLSPGYQVPFADIIRKASGIKTGAVGLITEARQANDIIVSQKADLVLIARESLRNPNFPLMAARELNADADWPSQYLRAKK